MPEYEMSAEAYRRLVAGTMPEREWRALVKELAAFHGWHVLIEIPDKVYRLVSDEARHDPSLIPAMQALRFWPDLMLGNPNLGRAFGLELKTERGKPSDGQLEKLSLLRRCGIPASVWRPRQEAVLEAVLRGETWD